MKIVLLYERLENDNTPFANAPFDAISHIYIDCKELYWVSFCNILSFNPNSDSIQMFPIDLQWQNVFDLFDNLKERTIFKMKKYKIPILFYFPSEGFGLKSDEYRHFFKNINQKIYDYELNSCPLFFITGNHKFNENNIKDIRFEKIFTVSYFENKLYKQLMNENFQDIEISSFKKTPTYDFLCYNGRSRSHRIALMSEIKRKKLLGNGLISFHVSKQDIIDAPVKEIYDLLYPHSIKYFENTIPQWEPMIIDKHTNHYIDSAYDIEHNHYVDTYFSLITETEYSSDSVFLTEKVFKPIKALHPFIIWGSPGMLSALKNRGYKTFPELFDESYDYEINSKKRLAMILDQVEQFSALHPRLKQRKRRKVLQKLLYNRNVFNENAQKLTQDYQKIFTEIGKILNDKKGKG